MTTLPFRVEMAEDGKLRVELSTDLPPGPVEGVVVVQPTRPQPQPPYDTLEGAFAGQLPDIDITGDIREIATAWKQDMELEP